MALITPEFLHAKTYSAKRDRLAFAHGGSLQAGVWDTGDFKVTQRASGANMSVDVAAGYALPPANDAGNLGLYHIQNDATANVTGFSASHATLPRLDQVYVLINDSQDGGDANDVPVFGIATGTATAGATLDTRNGAASIPNGALLLADVLIPATSTSVTTANIRDRRAWARGYFSLIRRAADYTSSSGSSAVIDATNISVRAECTGVPLRVTVKGSATPVTLGSTSLHFLGVNMDGVNVVDFNWYVTPVRAGQRHFFAATGTVVPTAGSRLIQPTYASNGTDNFKIEGATDPFIFTVEELVRPSANNGTA